MLTRHALTEVEPSRVPYRRLPPRSPVIIPHLQVCSSPDQVPYGQRIRLRRDANDRKLNRSEVRLVLLNFHYRGRVTKLVLPEVPDRQREVIHQ